MQHVNVGLFARCAPPRGDGCLPPTEARKICLLSGRPPLSSDRPNAKDQPFVDQTNAVVLFTSSLPARFFCPRKFSGQTQGASPGLQHPVIGLEGLRVERRWGAFHAS